MRKSSIVIIIIAIAAVVVSGNIYFFSKRNALQNMERDVIIQKYRDEIKTCESFSNVSNNLIKSVNKKARFMIALPEETYPQKGLTISKEGSSTADIVSNEENLFLNNQTFVKNNCWSHYYELNGTGTIIFNIPSIIEGIPDYILQFEAR